jgi:choline dehydrogenase
MRDRNVLCDAFIDAAVAEGFRRNPDYNNGDQEGFAYFQVTQKDGRRWSAARAFLDAARARPNLTIATHAQATRLLLENRQCVGVEYRRDGALLQARCKREVVLAAGAVQSPQLLELSGIGQPELLRAFGITVVHELPGVGENYRDHYAPRMSWRVKQPVTLNDQLQGVGLVREAVRYILLRRGALTFAGGTACGFVRTRPEIDFPDVQYHFAHASFSSLAVRKLDRKPGMTVTVYQCRPESRGSIHLKSPDPFAAPAIRANFLSEPYDQQCLLAGMKIARRIINNVKLDDFRAEEIGPGNAVQTDDEWLAYARASGQTTFHVVGTCRMGNDAMAVVDDRLRVHGIGGLRVVDASVMPTMVSGNTNAATMMIAEKGADMLRFGDGVLAEAA